MSKINIDCERCKGCRLCIVACLKGVITISNEINALGYYPAVKIEGKEKDCTACGRCYQMCPDIAIEIWKE